MNIEIIAEWILKIVLALGCVAWILAMLIFTIDFCRKLK